MSAQVSKEMVAGVVADSVDSSIAGAARSKWEGISPTAQLVGLVIAVWGTLIVMMIWVSGIQASLLSEISDLSSDTNAQISDLKTDLSEQISDLKSDLTKQIDAVDDRLRDVEFGLTLKMNALDAKLNAIGDMTVIAFKDGNIDSAELSEIWDRARDTTIPADESQSE